MSIQLTIFQRGSDYGFVLTGWQAIIWINDGLITDA